MLRPERGSLAERSDFRGKVKHLWYKFDFLIEKLSMLKLIFRITVKKLDFSMEIWNFFRMTIS